VDRWHRERFCACWRRRSRRPGSPRIDSDLRALISRLRKENRLWGAPRIHGELLKLGVSVSERTASRCLPNRPTVPSQTWRTFLTNHLGDLILSSTKTLSDALDDDDVVDGSVFSLGRFCVVMRSAVRVQSVGSHPQVTVLQRTGTRKTARMSRHSASGRTLATPPTRAMTELLRAWSDGDDTAPSRGYDKPGGGADRVTAHRQPGGVLRAASWPAGFRSRTGCVGCRGCSQGEGDRAALFWRVDRRGNRRSAAHSMDTIKCDWRLAKLWLLRN
jgi:hypothetical protein